MEGESGAVDKHTDFLGWMAKLRGGSAAESAAESAAHGEGSLGLPFDGITYANRCQCLQPPAPKVLALNEVVALRKVVVWSVCTLQLSCNITE